MNGFLIEAENKPGQLADIAEAIAARGINITGGAATTAGGHGGILITSSDHDATRSVLDGLACSYREIGLAAAALDDRPGALAAAARRLADAGVNIEALVLTGMAGGKVTVAFGVDDVQGATTALGDLAAGS